MGESPHPGVGGNALFQSLPSTMNSNRGIAPRIGGPRMPAALEELARPVIIGRSSSHFTRVTRIFAAEMHVDYSFRVVRDLMSSNPEDYGGNPALKIPSLQTPRGVWFGSLNVCRELWRQANPRPRVVWPEEHDE